MTRPELTDLLDRAVIIKLSLDLIEHQVLIHHPQALFDYFDLLELIAELEPLFVHLDQQGHLQVHLEQQLAQIVALDLIAE